MPWLNMRYKVYAVKGMTSLGLLLCHTQKGHHRGFR